MIIKSAEFLMSNSTHKKCPEPIKPEFAFIGRSNVGKSSLINMLVNRKSLAKTSSKPGKTQLINHFEINQSWYLVDLPGYGYAKASIKNREIWGKMITNYLLERENLMLVFVLIDSRLSPQKIDIEFLEFLGENQIPFEIVFTKIDKQGPKVTQDNASLFEEKMFETWEELPKYFLSSAIYAQGREEILDEIESIIPMFNPHANNKEIE